MKKILIILIMLIIILISLSYFQKNRSSNKDGIEISYKGQSRFLSYSKILSFEKSNFTTIQNHEMNGFELFKVLEELDISTSTETEFIFQSEDGGSLKLIKKPNEAFYLVFQEGANGQYIRLVIPSDEFSQRWIKYITSIEIK